MIMSSVDLLILLTLLTDLTTSKKSLVRFMRKRVYKVSWSDICNFAISWINREELIAITNTCFF